LKSEIGGIGESTVNCPGWGKSTVRGRQSTVGLLVIEILGYLYSFNIKI